MKFVSLCFIVFCCIFLYLHLFVLPALPIFYEEDHLYFIQDAWRMFQGEAIYRDFFQITFPGTQLLYLSLLYVFGTKFWVINAVVFLQGILQTSLCWLIAKRVIDNPWYSFLPPSLYLFFGFRWFEIDGSHRMLSPIFIWLAIFVLLKNRNYLNIFLAGLLCALASFFSQQRRMLAVGGIALFLLFESLTGKKDWRKLLIAEVILSATFALTLLALIHPFIISAGAETFFLRHIFLYQQLRSRTDGKLSGILYRFKKSFRSGFSDVGRHVFLLRFDAVYIHCRLRFSLVKVRRFGD